MQLETVVGKIEVLPSFILENLRLETFEGSRNKNFVLSATYCPMSLFSKKTFELYRKV